MKSAQFHSFAISVFLALGAASAAFHGTKSNCVPWLPGVVAVFAAPSPVFQQDESTAKQAGSAQPNQKAQTPGKKAASSAPQKSAASKTDVKEKPSLSGITRVSTDEAARGAASDLAGKKLDLDPNSGANDSAVLELHSVESGPSDAVITRSDTSKKSALKNVHGSVYGSADPRHTGTHETAASVGATSKGGKTSVYVGTDRSRISPQQ